MAKVCHLKLSIFYNIGFLFSLGVEGNIMICKYWLGEREAEEGRQIVFFDKFPEFPELCISGTIDGKKFFSKGENARCFS